MRPELTGKRNLHYSRRHRIYGSQMKQYDIDSMEFHHLTKQPVAMIETKFGLVQEIDLNNDEFDCLYNVAEKLDIPLFCLVYYPMDKFDCLLDANDDHKLLHHMQFLVIPCNNQSKKFLPGPMRLTEADWVGILYKLRGLTPNPPFSLSSTWMPVRCPKVIPRLPHHTVEVQVLVEPVQTQSDLKRI